MIASTKQYHPLRRFYPGTHNSRPPKRSDAGGNHRVTDLAKPLYMRRPELFTTAMQARKLISEKRGRAPQYSAGRDHRFGLSISQVERLRNFCRGSAYKKLGNRP